MEPTITGQIGNLSCKGQWQEPQERASKNHGSRTPTPSVWINELDPLGAAMTFFLVSPNCPGKARLCRCRSAGKYFENLAHKIWIKHVRMFLLWMNAISLMPTHPNISWLGWLRWGGLCILCFRVPSVHLHGRRVVAGGILTTSTLPNYGPRAPRGIQLSAGTESLSGPKCAPTKDTENPRIMDGKGVVWWLHPGDVDSWYIPDMYNMNI